MRRIGGEAGMALWFLVAAFVALMVGRARAESAAPQPAPALASMAPSPDTSAPPAPLAVDVAAKAFRGQVLFSDVMIARPLVRRTKSTAARIFGAMLPSPNAFCSSIRTASSIVRRASRCCRFPFAHAAG